MNPEFWQKKRWQEGRIGFNQSTVNPLLTEYFNRLNLTAGSRIFVPLCGKSIDMVWLATQGYDVVGVELVETAVQEFFLLSKTSNLPSINRQTIQRLDTIKASCRDRPSLYGSLIFLH